MIYRVRLVNRAAKFFKSVDPSLSKRLARAFEVLEESPRQHPNIKALKGELAGRYRYRVGDYRVIYRIDDDAADVIVLLIKHRRDAYE
ncbi:type II toxin-antitoxin system RelE/ParE family toxin [Nodosilinea sp. LEGE 07298]|uniref:type II toxin-antitoxin system RelE family toxin n=1 Tax=Nodosilinea sp. LEGE 07298 TaxID=2777970 RepID=UPI001882E00F|nr:type II toxin-antitoxin system RelE/ParE family toxin [Nodosilinea sp. LEGE 07298]